MTAKKTDKPTGRDEKGKLLKGFSGNPSGRPLSDMIPKEVITAVNKLKTNKDKIEFWDKYLLEHPRTTVEVRQVLALIRDSYTPKLKSVETNTKVDTKIEISWLIENRTDQDKLIDVTKSHNSTENSTLIESSTGIDTLKTKDEAIRETKVINNGINDLDEDWEEDF